MNMAPKITARLLGVSTNAARLVFGINDSKVIDCADLAKEEVEVAELSTVEYFWDRKMVFFSLYRYRWKGFTSMRRFHALGFPTAGRNMHNSKGPMINESFMTFLERVITLEEIRVNSFN